jgi:hypothetical protein
MNDHIKRLSLQLIFGLSEFEVPGYVSVLGTTKGLAVCAL